MKLKPYFKAVLIDVVFVSVLYGFIYFIIKRLQTLAQQLQLLSADTYDIENYLAADQMDKFDVNQLAGNLDLLTNTTNSMIFYFMILFLGIFILTVFILSLQSFISHTSKKSFQSYVGKMMVLSFIPSLTLLFLSFLLLQTLKNALVISFTQSQVTFFIFISLFCFLFLLALFYLTLLTSVYILHHPFFVSLKKGFVTSYHHLRLFFVLVGLVVLNLFILLFSSSSTITLLIGVLFITLLWNVYRTYLFKKMPGFTRR